MAPSAARVSSTAWRTTIQEPLTRVHDVTRNQLMLSFIHSILGNGGPMRERTR
jgi:hypothetical protein